MHSGWLFRAWSTRPAPQPPPPAAQPADARQASRDEAVRTLLYDGDCGFCAWSVTHLMRLAHPPVRAVPWQRADLAALNIPVARVRTEVVLIDGDRRLAAQITGLDVARISGRKAAYC